MKLGEPYLFREGAASINFIEGHVIISQKHGFFFIHIPKNGGSSVRDQIQHLDDTKGQFLGTKIHSELGRYDSSHVPLKWLHDYWPGHYDTLQTLDGYAIMREPVERFASSVTQRFRQFHKKTPTQLTPSDIHHEIQDIIEQLLGQGERFPQAKFSHFIPQFEFVNFGGQRQVHNLYRLSDIDLLIEQISQKGQLNLKRDFHSNKSFELRYKWLNRPVLQVKDVAKKLLPPRYLDILRHRTIKVLAKPQITAIHSIVLESKDIKRFITDYYRTDLELFESTPLRRSS